MPLDCTKPRFQPRQCNISVGQPQHEVRRFGHSSKLCAKSSLPLQPAATLILSVDWGLRRESAPPAYHRSHGSLKRIARDLSQSTGNQDFLALFNAAEQIHVNFYENTRSAAAVQAGILDSADYVALAETHLPAPPY